MPERVSPFPESDLYSPGFGRVTGALYLFKVGETWRLYRKRGKAPFGAIWRFEGKMDRLRRVADTICDANKGRLPSEGEHCVVFDSMPELPHAALGGVRQRRRLNKPTIVPEDPRRISDRTRHRRTKTDELMPGDAQRIAPETPIADTKPQEAAPQRAKRKTRKRRKGVSTEPAQTAVAVAEDPAVKTTDTETSANDDPIERSGHPGDI